MNYAIFTDIIVSVCIGAALFGAYLYIRASQTRKTYILTIGILNFVISFSMLLIILFTLRSLATPVSAGSDIFQAPFIRVGLLIIIVFIIGQTIYLFVPSSPFHQQIRQLLHSLRTSAETKEAFEQEDGIEKEYLTYLCSDVQLTALQIIDMSAPLNLLDVYVDRKLYKERSSQVLQQENVPAPMVVEEYDQEEPEEDGWEMYDPGKLYVDHKHSVILGDLGIGKTTSLRYLALRLAQKKLQALEGNSSTLEEIPLPIYVELNTLASQGKTNLLEFIVTTICSRSMLDADDLLKWLKEKLRHDRVLLLLDALDETLIGEDAGTAQDTYTTVQKMISKFAKNYASASIVVTSRKVSYNRYAELRDNEGPFHRFELLGFTRQQDRNQFIRNWFKQRSYLPEHISADDLIFRLGNDERLQALTTNPLLLSLVAIVYERELGLPDRRAVLYERCVDILLGRGDGLSKWDSSKGVLRQYDFPADMKQHVLERIAWYFQSEGRSRAGEEKVVSIVRAFLKERGESQNEALNLLNEITATHGLLKVEKEFEETYALQKGKEYRFLLSSFQAYFAAYDALNEDRLDELLSHRAEDDWEEVILLYSAYSKSVRPLWQKLWEKENDDIFLTNLILTGRCIAAAAPKLWSNFSAKVRDYLLDSLKEPSENKFTQGDPQHLMERYRFAATRYLLTSDRVAGTLVEIGSEEINTSLLAMFADKNVSRQRQRSITRALMECKQRSLSEQLLPLLSDPEVNIHTRQEIADILGRLGDQSIASALIGRFLNPGTDTNLQYRIINVLSYLAEPKLLPRLKEPLSYPKLDKRVGKSIAEILGKQGELSLLEDLFPLLYNEKILLSIRCAFVLALAQRDKDKNAIADALYPPSIDTRLEIRLRANCLLVLYALNKQDTLAEDLLKTISDEKIGSQLRCDLVSSMGELRTSSLAPRLIGPLSNERTHRDVRKKIAEVLRKLGNEAIFQKLIALLKDLNAYTDKTNLPIYVNIVRCIGSSRDGYVIDALLDLISNYELRGHDVLLEAISKELANYGSHGEMTETIKRRLQQIEHLTLSDGNLFRESDTRRSIVITLGMLGDTATLDELMQSLLEPRINSPERKRIENAIEDLGNQTVDERLKVVERLKKELSRSDRVHSRDVRKSILTVMKSLAADEGTCWLLVRLLETSELQKEIYNALWEISRRAGVRIFRDMKDPATPYCIQKYKWF